MYIGFIGLGVMGTPMAVNLARAGNRVLAWSRSSRNDEAARSAGIERAGSVQEVFNACHTVIMMLANDEAIDAVLLRRSEDFDTYVQGRLLINMGTSSAAYSRALADQVRRAGGRYVEAPVSGSRLQAEAA